MTSRDSRRANEETRDVWNHNADFWDERMGEGNDFVEVLIWPATERLLELRPGERVLDIACGNGLTSRRLGAMEAAIRMQRNSRIVQAPRSSRGDAVGLPHRKAGRGHPMG